MADTTETPPVPEQPPAEQPPADSRPSRSPRPWGLLALLLSLLVLAAAAAGGYLLWQQLQALQAAQTGLVRQDALGPELGNLREGQQTLQSRLEQLAAEDSGTERRLREFDAQLEAILQQQRGLEERLGRLDAEAAERRAEWLRSEAAFLANIAVHRVRLQGDVDGALTALRLADQLLARLGGEALPGRQALHRAMDQLVGVSLPDVDDLAARLEQLATQVDVLPLDLQLDDVAVAREQAAEAAAAPPPAGWRGSLNRAWERFKETLGELVVVQRDRAVEPLIVPEERYFLYHNLRLRLEAARLALIEGNEAVYRRSLSRAAEWIERYYALGEPAVEQALAELAELRRVDIDPAMPDIAPLLEPVLSY